MKCTENVRPGTTIRGCGDGRPVVPALGVRMSNTPAAGPGADIRSFGEKWWLLAVFGVITLGFGLVALTFQPGNSVHTIAVIIGIWLLILGVFRLIQVIGATG